MPKQNGLRLPRKYMTSLLLVYTLMGVVSILAGGYLAYTSYQMRVSAIRNGAQAPGTVFVMIVGAVIVAFGVWRCVLAFYHLNRMRAARR